MFKLKRKNKKILPKVVAHKRSEPFKFKTSFLNSICFEYNFFDFFLSLKRVKSFLLKFSFFYLKKKKKYRNKPRIAFVIEGDNVWLKHLRNRLFLNHSFRGIIFDKWVKGSLSNARFPLFRAEGELYKYKDIKILFIIHCEDPQGIAKEAKNLGIPTIGFNFVGSKPIFTYNIFVVKHLNLYKVYFYVVNFILPIFFEKKRIKRKKIPVVSYVKRYLKKKRFGVNYTPYSKNKNKNSYEKKKRKIFV